MESSENYPESWRWAENGDECVGTFVRIDEGFTSYGPRPIVVLKVSGEERSVWLNAQALRSKFAEEIERRASGELNPGELVQIVRGEEKDSAAGRRYRAFSVRFPERPKRSSRAILGLEREPEPSGNEQQDEIPF